ncbi:hypothetical protein OM076_00530 [Solirubrobacter ginsenosidimutans]|uniref:Galactose oxidase n=1 Tax=Solirubrobacter ginsenosidimutans TaxID=490573 RepID=A0A9X3RZD3_9ACTN|nr:kelch repeat-containing protein [Solirubrobacter ginsenosidimutans]MDA0158732.1 hypothetical protein [Solirubrobacter ginsenosidimutans]
MAARADTAGVWTTAGGMSASRAAPVAFPLPDGGALVAGGFDWTRTRDAERYNAAKNSWTAAAPMRERRYSAATVPLADGRVLVAGGISDSDPTATAELYDPATGAWTATGSMLVARSDHDGVLLADGRVLVFGGNSGGSLAEGAEIWDPATGTWKRTSGPVMPRDSAAMVRLTDGKVLVVGGWNGDYLDTTDVYDPVADTWTAGKPMGERRGDPGAVPLPDGRILVAGGYTRVGVFGNASRTSEIYDPAQDSWTPSGLLHRGRAMSEMGNLAGGRPFISGGHEFELHVIDGMLQGVEQNEDTLELYDIDTGTWQISPPAPLARWSHAAVPLRDGSLLLAGTSHHLTGLSPTTVDRYFPPGLTPPTAMPSPTPTATPTVTPEPTPSATPAPETPRITPQPVVKPLPPVLAALPKALKADAKGRIALRLRCTGAGTCRDTLTLKTRAGKRLARTVVRIAAGRTATVRLTLGKAGLRALKGRSTNVTLELTQAKVHVRGTLKRS